MPRPERLSRKHTADLLKELRDLARERRMLRAEIDKAKDDALNQHSKAVHPSRARTRK